jgi:hypothetical protein
LNPAAAALAADKPCWAHSHLRILLNNDVFWLSFIQRSDDEELDRCDSFRSMYLAGFVVDYVSDLDLRISIFIFVQLSAFKDVGKGISRVVRGLLPAPASIIDTVTSLPSQPDRSVFKSCVSLTALIGV